MEKLIEKNYYLHKSAQEAYKAYIRAYDSHSHKQIFDVHTLDLPKVCLSFGFQIPPYVDLSILYPLTFTDRSAVLGVSSAPLCDVPGEGEGRLLLLLHITDLLLLPRVLTCMSRIPIVRCRNTGLPIEVMGDGHSSSLSHRSHR